MIPEEMHDEIIQGQMGEMQRMKGKPMVKETANDGRVTCG